MNNLLILSSGTRVELVNYFKETFSNRGKIVCADNSPFAPTLYVADKGYVVPKITDKNYFDNILDICRKENIVAMFSLIDPELTLLSQKKDYFESFGIKVIISDYDTTNLCFDKFKTAQHLKKINLPFIPSYLSKDLLLNDLEKGKIEFPLFRKPNQGSASIGIGRIYSKDEIIETPDTLYQVLMDGKEYGVDVYIDLLSGEIVDIFIKEKLLMRAGETDKSISVKNEVIKDIVVSFVNSLNFRGQIDIDIFEKDGVYYISEVNPRFGGGYLHAYGCGVNFPKYLLNNLEGKENAPFKRLNYKEKNVMMKYVSVVFCDENE